MPVPVAPLDEQTEIVRSLNAVNQRITAEESGLAALGELKVALASDLLTGRTRVASAATEAA